MKYCREGCLICKRQGGFFPKDKPQELKINSKSILEFFVGLLGVYAAMFGVAWVAA